MFAFVFDSVGAGEWLVLLAVLLVVMGPKRLPATARKIGAYYSKFRRAADSFKRQLMDMDTEFERAVNDASKDVEKDLEDVARPPEGLEEEPLVEPTVESPSEQSNEPPVEPVAENGNQSHQES